MKLIIDIPEEQYNTIKSDLYNTFSAEMKMWGLGAMQNGIPIPDNATNGDVIKAMFPNIITDEFASTIHTTTKVVSNGVKGVISYDFWKDWWNSLYQKGE